MPAPLKGECELLCHDLGVEVGVLDLVDLDSGVLKSVLLLDGRSQVLDGLSLPTDDESRALGGEDDGGSHRGPLDVESSESCALDLIHEVFLEKNPANILGNELSL